MGVIWKKDKNNIEFSHRNLHSMLLTSNYLHLKLSLVGIVKQKCLVKLIGTRVMISTLRYEWFGTSNLVADSYKTKLRVAESKASEIFII